MLENNNSSFYNSPMREQENSKKFDNTRKSNMEGSVSKNVSRE